jgi:hypothetical protein
LNRGLLEAQAAVNRFAGKRVGAIVLNPLLAVIRVRYQLTSLDAVPQGTRWTVRGTVNPTAGLPTDAQVEEGAAGATTAGSESTEPIFGPTAAGFGTSVRVMRLTKNHARGSAPTVEGGHWNILRTRMDGGSTYYVRGHLLNDNLGGTGGDWKNLTPLTQATNNRSAVSMLHTFETPVKSAVEQGKTVDFAVTITYGRPNRSADAAFARNSIEPADEGEKIERVILAEEHVPTSVQGTAKSVAADGTVAPLVSSTSPNTIDVNLDHYETSARPRRLLNINSVSASDLTALNGVDAAMAARIIALRPVKDKTDARKKLGDSVWHALVSTAGISIRFK